MVPFPVVIPGKAGIHGCRRRGVHPWNETVKGGTVLFGEGRTDGAERGTKVQPRVQAGGAAATGGRRAAERAGGGAGDQAEVSVPVARTVPGRRGCGAAQLRASDEGGGVGDARGGWAAGGSGRGVAGPDGGWGAGKAGAGGRPDGRG